MTYGALPGEQIAAALYAYNTAAARQCAALPGVTWAELMNWAEIHHILTSRYAADGRYPRHWHEVRPTSQRDGRANMAVITSLLLTRHGEAHCNVAGVAGGREDLHWPDRTRTDTGPAAGRTAVRRSPG